MHGLPKAILPGNPPTPPRPQAKLPERKRETIKGTILGFLWFLGLFAASVWAHLS